MCGEQNFPTLMAKVVGVFAYCIFYYYTFIKNYSGKFVTNWDSFQIMLPGGGTMVAFSGKIMLLGRGICKCLGANAWGFPWVNPPGWPLISA